MWNRDIRNTINEELKPHYTLDNLIGEMPIKFYKGNGNMCIIVDNNKIITEYNAYTVKTKIDARFDAIMANYTEKYKGHKIIYDLNTEENIPVYDMTDNKMLSYKFFNHPPDLFEYVLGASKTGIFKIYAKSGLASLIHLHQDLSDLIACKPESNLKFVISAWCKLNNTNIVEHLLKDYELFPEGADLISNEKFSRLNEIMKKVIHPKVPLLPPPVKSDSVVDKIVNVLLNTKESVLLSDLSIGKFPPVSKNTISVELDIPVKECGITKINICNGLVSVYSNLRTITNEDVEDLTNLKSFILIKPDAFDTYDDNYYYHNFRG